MKETHYKLKQRVTALFAAAVMLCSMLPGAAFAEEPTPQPTEETVQMEQQTEPSETDNGQTDESSPDPGEDVTEATPETAEEQPAEEEISAAVVGAELYTDLPDTPIGSYIGSEGLPVATGETKIGISEWPESQLEETSDSYLTAAALDNDGLTMAAPLLDGADYAIVPIMAQVEYPADGSSTDMILPDGVTLLDFYGEPATDADALLHNSYHETSAAVMGVYVQAAADFNAQLVYTGSDGSTQTKTLYVTIDREHTVASPFADAGIAAYGERPIPDVTSGKITKVAKVNGTWLIWFNGEPAYCCTPGADGQPKNCPTYTYKPLMESHYTAPCPTIKDLWMALNNQRDKRSKEIALALRIFATGSMQAFAQPTNVDMSNRLICFNIQSLGEQLKPVAMLSMLEYINTAVMSNERNDPKAATWVYFDEIYLLLRDSLSANFLYTSWKRFRKYNAYATGITQNVQDCLTNDTAYAMLANSEFVVMLRQTKDIDSVVELYGLSEPQRKYLLLAQPGEGIIKMGNSLIPFNNPQPKDTKTYKLLTTKPGEME